MEQLLKAIPCDAYAKRVSGAVGGNTVVSGSGQYETSQEQV